MGGVTVKDVTAVHQPRSGVGAAKRRSASLRERRAKLALKILLPVAVVVWLFRVGVPRVLVPIWGPSMRPTMAVWNLPSPLESLSFSGWVHYDPDREPEIGNIVYFKVPNTRFREVKRVAKINESGDLWVTPDNSGVSGEGSDNSELYDWVPRDSVKGVVDDIYTPARFFRSFTTRGQLRNWVEMEYSPANIRWSGDLVATTGGGAVDVWDRPRRSIFSARYVSRVEATYSCEWRGGRLVFMSAKRPHIYTVFDPVVGSHYRFDASTSWPWPDIVKVEGGGRVFVRANAEDVLYLRSRGFEPRVSIDGVVTDLVSPEKNNGLAEWSGEASVVKRVNCLFALELYGS